MGESGAAIFLTPLGFYFLGAAVHDALHPRTQG